MVAAGERVAINTGPLIALAKADAIDVAGQLPIEFVCPQEVERELTAGTRSDRILIQPTWLRVLPLAEPLPALVRPSVDPGEAAVIQLALEQGINWVCMDDRQGRRAALAVGLHVTGTLGLLMRAKVLKIIPAIRPFTDRLTKVGVWFHPELVRRVLQEAGE